MGIRRKTGVMLVKIKAKEKEKIQKEKAKANTQKVSIKAMRDLAAKVQST